MKETYGYINPDNHCICACPDHAQYVIVDVETDARIRDRRQQSAYLLDHIKYVIGYDDTDCGQIIDRILEMSELIKQVENETAMYNKALMAWSSISSRGGCINE